MARRHGSRNHNGAPCSVPVCDRDAKKRGWCIRHYKRWERTGSPTGSTRPTRWQRFWLLVDREQSGCWIWGGFCDAKGYGHFDGTTAHRAAYELLIGNVPEGLDLDHECRNTSCVNPYHLDPVTADENNRRARLAQAA